MKKTPMMKQYIDFKRQYPDKIVLFRMGDFYETFGDDAILTSKVLNITLTARDRNEDPTPLAGFPYHALDQYLPKIVKAGYSAVIVDQIEDPKLAKGIVKRAVTRVVTPGTLDGDLADESKNTYLMALYRIKGLLGAALVDVSTGEFKVTEIPYSKNHLASLLSSYAPVEALIVDEEKDILMPKIPVQILPAKDFEGPKFEKIIKDFYKVKNIEALGIKKYNSALIATAMVLVYIKDTQKMDPLHLAKPSYFDMSGRMVLDQSTIRNLELVDGSGGNPKSALISVLNETKTNMGRRLLYSWILNPLLKLDEVCRRLDVVEYFVNNYDVLLSVRELLGNISDIERITGKIGLNRASGRDYKALEISIDNAYKLLELLPKEIRESSLFEFDKYFSDKKRWSITELQNLISKSIDDNAPVVLNEGWIFKSGYSKEVDELRSLSGDSKSWLKEFTEKERERTGITSLKVDFNRVFGYYIEVTNAHKDKVPAEYIRKQTLVNAERYITEELKVKEEIILGAQDKLISLELKLFQEFREKTLNYLSNLQLFGRDVAVLDVLSGFGFASRNMGYTKPVVLDYDAGIIDIKGGRHPVVEMISDEDFVSNDTFMDMFGSRMCILTGPNMSGKSTYIRQVALIVLMAQIGCFVPADSAKISMVDRIFTRVGASDDLSAGRSTFMVEMDEAANIVNNATEHSLVILDEVGRGTSTYDGVSIAWALAEFLVSDVRCRALFATHYHELLKLEDEFDSIKNYNVAVDEDEARDEVVFLRKIVAGGTDRSYGIYVARLAGLPSKVIDRAKEILLGFEQESMFGTKSSPRHNHLHSSTSPHPSTVPESKPDHKQLGLFDMYNTQLLDELRKLDINSLSPLEALNKLAEWKRRV